MTTILKSQPHADPRPPDDRPAAQDSSALAREFRTFTEEALADFPHEVELIDWHGASWRLGGTEPHWSGNRLRVRFDSADPARALMSLNGLGFLERFVNGEVHIEGNLFLLSLIRKYARLKLRPRQILLNLFRVVAFQNRVRAKVNVKSHYDIPQDVLDIYLDKKYMSYSCAIFEDPEHLDRDDMLRPGLGRDDDYDSLEKAQWRKFKDATDFIAPRQGETLLDIGCGYGGQLQVALETHPFGKVVGWTHSSNQRKAGAQMMSEFDPASWELNEGDYRESDTVYDHITSTGMISHVGPRGLTPYVRQVRRRIKKGGRYLHHALMTAHKEIPLDMNVGIAFNKRYVWPGFHWFTVGQHVRALEKNGFQVERMTNLSTHYAKTTAAWYERMMGQREQVESGLGNQTFRAWQIFLAGITGSFLSRDIHVYRLYCVAT